MATAYQPTSWWTELEQGKVSSSDISSVDSAKKAYQAGQVEQQYEYDVSGKSQDRALRERQQANVEANQNWQRAMATQAEKDAGEQGMLKGVGGIASTAAQLYMMSGKMGTVFGMGGTTPAVGGGLSTTGLGAGTPQFGVTGGTSYEGAGSIGADMSGQGALTGAGVSEGGWAGSGAATVEFGGTEIALSTAGWETGGGALFGYAAVGALAPKGANEGGRAIIGGVMGGVAGAVIGGILGGGYGAAGGAVIGIIGGAIGGMLNKKGGGK